MVPSCNDRTREICKKSTTSVLAAEVAEFPAMSIKRTVTAPPVGIASCNCADVVVFMFSVTEVAVAAFVMFTVPITVPFSKNSAWLKVESAVVQLEEIDRFTLALLRVFATELPVMTKVGALAATGARASMFTVEVDESDSTEPALGRLTLALTLPARSVTLPVPDQAPVAA